MGNRQTIVIVLFSNQISPVRKNGLVKFIAPIQQTTNQWPHHSDHPIFIQISESFIRYCTNFYSEELYFSILIFILSALAKS